MAVLSSQATKPKPDKAANALAKGNLTPAQAADVRHAPGVVSGMNDSTYHGRC